MSYSYSDLSHLPLGKDTSYNSSYQPNLLQAVPRQLNRQQLGIAANADLPFSGADIWTLYELSWLNQQGLPQVAIGEVTFPATSANIVESKSFKLYLTSLNQTKFESKQQLQQLLINDLSQCCQAKVQLQLFSLDEYSSKPIQNFSGHCIDQQDISISNYQYQPELLQAAGAADTIVTETLSSHLLKSNCLITQQPDWGSLQISYTGRQINPAALLKYIISFRQHNEFHEQCVERIFTDLMQYCQPEKLTVYARYTRRGGLDINPWRSNQAFTPNSRPLARQ